MFHPRFDPGAEATARPQPDTGGMTTTDYLLNGILVLSIVRQLHGKRLAGINMLIPFAVVAYVVPRYLQSVPTSGNGLVLVVLGTAAGLTLGSLCGVYSLVYRGGDGALFIRATRAAAVLWVLGVGARLAFELYAQHGGGPAIASFSAAHSLTMQAWIAALILMALAEVVSRTAVVLVRSRRLAGAIIPVS
jgi:hypothetical protein